MGRRSVTTPAASALAAVRGDLATYLGSTLGLQAFSELPEKVTPPFLSVGPGDPYVEFEGATFGHRRVRLLATIVGDVGTNDVRVAELDAYIVAIVEALDASDDYLVFQVDQPGQIAINGQAHLGATVQAFTEITF